MEGADEPAADHEVERDDGVVVSIEALNDAMQAGVTAAESNTGEVDSKKEIWDPKSDAPDNLVELEEMTKDILLASVKERYEKDALYTYVADILVAVNPYRWIDMFGVNFKERYSPVKLLCNVPHVYGIAQAAAKNLRMLNRNQVCLISGESGAGKTETAKLFMHHLLTFSEKGGDVGTTALERKILESQPLLEAFGNAQTGLNDNSSRFGKYIEVLFEGMDSVVGARVRKYLLEKSRVIKQNEGERNFHAFYYLADSAAGQALGLKGSDGYRYTKVGQKSADSDARFNELDGSMRALGFAEEEIASLWTVLAAILKCGELEFEDIEGSTDDSCKFKDAAIAQDLADTLDVSVDLLYNGVTTKHLVTAGETFHKPINAENSGIMRDILAQNMYDNLFSWLVDQLNVKMAPAENADEEFRSVAVLDIFGFENFQHNGFEQLFINTANERLQQYFIQHIFTYEIKELKEEGVKCPKVDYTSNDDQVGMLLGQPGIFSMLDEQTKVPNSDDKSTILKFHSELNGFAQYDDVRKSTIEFQITHYAGAVRYQVAGFLEKNKNTPSLGIAGMMKSSNNMMIKGLFKSSVTTEEKQKAVLETKEAVRKGAAGGGRFMRKASRILHKKQADDAAAADKAAKKRMPAWKLRNLEAAGKAPEPVKKKRLGRVGSEKKRAALSTLAAGFKGSLDDLMEMLNAATPHFIRCIKPNMVKKPNTFNSEFTQTQLNYTGVLETTKIRKLGYPLRVSFADFVDRYRDVCMPPTQRLLSDVHANTCVRILQAADLHGWAQGKTKMLLQYEHVRTLVDILEGKKRDADEQRAAAKVIQDKKDAEAAVIKAKRDAEVAKIRAAAEAQPSKIDNGLSWQEEMDLAKKKKAERKKKQDAEDAAAAAAAAACLPVEDGGIEYTDCDEFRPGAFKKLQCVNCYTAKALHKPGTPGL
jgi:myosin-3